MNVTSGSIELALRTDSSNYSGSVKKIKPSGKPVSLTKEFRENTLRSIQEMNAKLEKWHLRLGIAGMTPVVGIVFDGAGAVLYAFSGEYGEAVFAVLAAIPGIGDLGKAARTTVKVGEQTKDVVFLSQKQIDLVTKEVEKKADDIKKVTDKSNPHIVDDQAAFVHVVSGGKGKGVVLRKGSFSIFDWEGYPEGLLKPKGPFKLLKGEEYKAARIAANTTNQRLRRQNPGKYTGKEIHEIHPVKYGGSPTDPANKVALRPEEHRKFTNFWNRIQKKIEHYTID